MSTTTLRVGSVVPPRRLTSLSGDLVSVPAPGRLVHLQFRRFSGCPVCSLHLRGVARRHEELVRANILEVAVFHSPAESMRPYQHQLPFAVIPDPRRALYVAFGVEKSPAAMRHPRAILAALRGAIHGMAPPGSGESPLGLPADFLIHSNGTIAALHRGVHADDQWSVDDILRNAAHARPSVQLSNQAPLGGTQ